MYLGDGVVGLLRGDLHLRQGAEYMRRESREPRAREKVAHIKQVRNGDAFRNTTVSYVPNYIFPRFQDAKKDQANEGSPWLTPKRQGEDAKKKCLFLSAQLLAVE